MTNKLSVYYTPLGDAHGIQYASAVSFFSKIPRILLRSPRFHVFPKDPLQDKRSIECIKCSQYRQQKRKYPKYRNTQDKRQHKQASLRHIVDCQHGRYLKTLSHSQ